MGEKGERSSRNTYKGHMDKAKGGESRVGGRDGESAGHDGVKMETILLE